MSANEIIALAVFGCVSLGLVGLSIPLLMGKCAGLVAGYNTLSDQEKSQYDAPALARFTGKILLAVGLVTLPYGVGLLRFGWQWLTWVYLVVVVGLCMFAVAWCNTGDRFKK